MNKQTHGDTITGISERSYCKQIAILWPQVNNILHTHDWLPVHIVNVAQKLHTMAEKKLYMVRFQTYSEQR